MIHDRYRIAAEVSDLRVRFDDLVQQLSLASDLETKSQILAEARKLIVRTDEILSGWLDESHRRIEVLNRRFSNHHRMQFAVKEHQRSNR